MTWTAYIDGGSRGNPGPAAAGVELSDDTGRAVFAAGFFLGRMTNNQAEYHGLLKALEHLVRAGASRVEIVSDSELMVRQINGQYRVRSPDLQPLYARARELLQQLEQWRMRHVMREDNSRADALANKAMDARADVIVTDEIRPDPASKEAGRPGREAGATPSRRRGLPPARGTESEAARSSAETSPPTRRVEVVIERCGTTGACPADMKAGRRFAFTGVTPIGLCVDACASVIEAVCAVQAGRPAPSTLTCGRQGCDAVFRIEPTQDK